MAHAQAPPPKTKIEYVVFDVDGLLIDSERVYTEVTNQILARYGAEMTWEIKSGLMGKPERAAAEHLFDALAAAIPAEYTVDDYLAERRTLQDARWPTVPLLPGAARLVQHLHACGVPIALATGSQRRNMAAKTAHLRAVFGCFEGRAVCGDDAPGVRRSARGGLGLREEEEDEEEDEDGRARGAVEKGPLWARTMRGKPDPDVFLRAAGEVLGRDVGWGRVDGTEGVVSEAQKLERAKGLVFEDGVPGVQAALAGGFNVIWVPDESLLQLEHGLKIGHIPSLEHFKPEEWGLPPYDA